MPTPSGPTPPPGFVFVSRRYVPPPGAEPRWYGETLDWVPALDVSLELVDGGEYAGSLITPEPEPDPATGALALWFMVPGKLNLVPIPLADVVAFTVHTPVPEPPPGRRERLRILGSLPRLAWAVLTDHGEPPAPDPVTDVNPLYELITATVMFDRDDPAIVDHIQRSIEAALHGLPGLSDVDLDVRSKTPRQIRVDVLLRAPNGPDRDAATRDAMDAVVVAITPIETMPGVDLIEFAHGDL